MTTEYTNIFSDVLLKIVLSEQLGLFCFIFILNIFKELHSKKTSKTGSSSSNLSEDVREANPKKTGIKSSSQQELPVKSTTIYKIHKNVTSVKSDNKHNISKIKQSPDTDLASAKYNYSLKDKFESNSPVRVSFMRPPAKRPKPSKPKALFTRSLSVEEERPLRVAGSRKSAFKVTSATYSSMYNLMIFHSLAVTTVLANTSYNFYVISVIYFHMVMFILTFILFQREAKCAQLFEALTFSINTVLILLSLVHTANSFTFYVDFKNFIESYTFYV